jgi:hypothetical protein
MPLSTAPGAGCGGIPNRSWTGFVVGVSCMPSPKGLSAGLSTRDYGITVHIYFSQFISSLKVGAFLLISFCKTVFGILASGVHKHSYHAVFQMIYIHWDTNSFITFVNGIDFFVFPNLFIC